MGVIVCLTTWCHLFSDVQLQRSGEDNREKKDRAWISGYKKIVWRLGDRNLQVTGRKILGSGKGLMGMMVLIFRKSLLRGIHWLCRLEVMTWEWNESLCLKPARFHTANSGSITVGSGRGCWIIFLQKFEEKPARQSQKSVVRGREVSPAGCCCCWTH